MIRVTVMSGQPLLSHALRSALSGDPALDVSVVHPGGGRIPLEGQADAPDVLLLDVSAERQVPSWLADVLAGAGRTAVVVLAASAEPSAMLAAMQTGARVHECATVHMSVSEVQAVLHRAFAGTSAVPPLPAATAGGAGQASAGLGALTDREHDILRLLARGQTTAEIARAGGITVSTVRTHVRNILDKLGMHSRVEAAAFAARMGLQ